MKNFWIKVKGQWYIIGDTGKLQASLTTTAEDLTKLAVRVYNNETSIVTINSSIEAINEALGITGDSETSIAQQIQDLSGDIEKLKAQDTVTIAKDAAQDADILTLQQTLGLADDAGNPVKPSSKNAIDELTECCNETKETLQQVKTTADTTKATVDILTDPNNINSVANQIKAVNDDLQSKINTVDGKVDTLETRHDTEIDRLETVVGLTISGDKITSKFDTVQQEQATQDNRLDALENAVGLSGGSGDGSTSITTQVTEIRNDVSDIKDTLYNETTGHVKRIADLEAQNNTQDSSISDIMDVLGITDDSSGNPVSEALQNAAQCCEDNKAAIAANKTAIENNKTAIETNKATIESTKAAVDKLNNPNDPNSVASQITTVKLQLETAINANASAIDDLENVLEIVEDDDGNVSSDRLDRADKCCQDNAAAIAKLNSADDPDGIASKLAAVKTELETTISTSTETVRNDLSNDITTLQQKDATHDQDIEKLKTMLGVGGDGEDASLSVQVANLKGQVADIQSDIGTVPDGKTVVGLITDNTNSIASNATSITDIQNDIGTVPDGKTVVELITDNTTAITSNTASITSIQGNMGDWDTAHPDKTVTQVIGDLSTCCEDSKNRLDDLENSVGDINLGDNVTIGDAITNINNTIGTVPSGKNLQGQIDALQQQADTTDSTVSGLNTSLTNLQTDYNAKVTDFDTRIKANKTAIESNDTDIAALQSKDTELETAVNARIKMVGERGTLKGYEQVRTETATAADINLSIDSEDTWYITCTASATNLRFTPGSEDQCSVKVITLKNTVATGLSTGTGNTGDFQPAWANNNDAPEWGTLANQLLILIAHFIGGTVVLTVFHNSEA